VLAWVVVVVVVVLVVVSEWVLLFVSDMLTPFVEDESLRQVSLAQSATPPICVSHEHYESQPSGWL